MHRSHFLLFVLLLPCFGADKKIEPVLSGNDTVDLKGAVSVGREAATRLLGVDPGFDMVIVSVEVKPKSDDAKLAITRDDFTLLSRRDGQRSQAMHPSQIAGSGTMTVVSRGPGAGGAMLGRNRGPVWGGMPGTDTRPQRIGGDETAVGAGAAAETQAAIRNDEQNDNPVLAALKAKELPTGEVKESAAGLLYFILEGKHKEKDLELMYKGAAGTLMLDFVK